MADETTQRGELPKAAHAALIRLFAVQNSGLERTKEGWWAGLPTLKGSRRYHLGASIAEAVEKAFAHPETRT
jgi:hypothetical protein